MNNNIGTEHHPLRLLILDNDKNKARKIIALLRESRYIVKPALASNTREAIAALKKFVWDLVLVPADYPKPDSMRAFALLAGRRAFTPLLLLADSVNDPQALRAYSMGARDAISIDQPQHMLHVVQRELHDLCNRRMQNILELQNRTLKPHDTAATVQTTTAGSANIDTLIQSVAQQQGRGSGKYDSLTHLYARHYFIGELKQILNSIEDSSVQYGMLHIEPDHFKAIRDEKGLNASNIVLTEISRLLRHKLGQLTPISRLDNHAFAALVGYRDKQELINIAEKICSNLGNHIFPGLGTATPLTTASIGICIISGHCSDAHRILAKASRACAIAQSSGGNRIHTYNPETDEAEDCTVECDWESIIRDALKQNRFRLAFQPIVELHSMAHENYEILLRMIDPDGNEIKPDRFILTAEHTGLITSIDQWVVKQAIRELEVHQRDGKQANFFIKLSDETVNSSTFLPWLIKELKQSGIANHNLVFQINTTELSRHPIEIDNFIKLLKKIKCRSALEYFGTQSNQTDTIRQLPVDFLKIDRALIHNLADNPQNEDRIKHITALAQSVNKATIAEFVEDARTLSILWNAGVDYIQGHFLQSAEGAMNYNFSEQAI